MYKTTVKKTLALIMVLLVATQLFAQKQRKRIEAFKVSTPPEIDAVLDEKVWKNVPAATGFFQLSPYNGKSPTHKTEVKFIYDNNAIYIGAMLFDSAPDSILTELSVRDDAGMTDYFGVYIDPFNDALNSFGFFVTSRGVQIDKKLIGDNDDDRGSDDSWDAVWESEVKIIDIGWVIEMRIPYSALRFPKKDIQHWGINIHRNLKRYREISTWNLIDKEVAGMNAQAGELTGIKNITPPLRLSFVPYVSGYVESDPESSSWGYSYKGGLDIKYGINESFTLDMIMIPDFGQVRSDDEVYNFSPFEVYYGENRPFFTEGTELFDKGGVFYSRRIGAMPSGYSSVSDQLDSNEVIDKNPRETQLLNATKISGKTKKGLGIGFFNGMTSNTYATVKDTLTGKEREVLTQPFTNYNMIVLDQSLKNNSYLSFYNTNVLKEKDKYSANVTGTEFKLNNKKKTYSISGLLNVNQKYDEKTQPEYGHSYSVSFEKISGKFLFQLSQNVESDKYDPNDMGYLENNNEFENELEIRYNIYDPFWKILYTKNTLSIDQSSLYAPRKFVELNMELNTFTTFKNHLSVSLNFNTSPGEVFDYFEAREPGRVFIQPANFFVNAFLSPDYRKKFIVDCRFGFWQTYDNDQKSRWIEISPRYRINDKLTIGHTFDYDIQYANIGYVSDSTSIGNEKIIIFGQREIINITNTFRVNYKFSNKSSLNFRLRHYWLTTTYAEFYKLKEDGYLEDIDYNKNKDFTFNAFNIDMVYQWNFAPGSEMSIVWKNSIFTDNNEPVKDFYNNLKNTLESPATNSISLKILYFLDYQYLKKKK